MLMKTRRYADCAPALGPTTVYIPQCLKNFSNQMTTRKSMNAGLVVDEVMVIESVAIADEPVTVVQVNTVMMLIRGYVMMNLRIRENLFKHSFPLQFYFFIAIPKWGYFDPSATFGSANVSVVLQVSLQLGMTVAKFESSNGSPTFDPQYSRKVMFMLLELHSTTEAHGEKLAFNVAIDIISAPLVIDELKCYGWQQHAPKSNENYTLAILTGITSCAGNGTSKTSVSTRSKKISYGIIKVRQYGINVDKKPQVIKYKEAFSQKQATKENIIDGRM
ncbi:unnamed protein product [Soboliphyme baturini]|uniref:C2 domain-containing protein n=1 Tax=Soboliphyme baturini TaxID=241478 RepID=A0A183IMZ7_9BILA|nr:unnamed protein product [Soboliphyme baturini]